MGNWFEINGYFKKWINVETPLLLTSQMSLRKIDALSGQASFSSARNLESNSLATRIQPPFVMSLFKDFLDDRLFVLDCQSFVSFSVYPQETDE